MTDEEVLGQRNDLEMIKRPHLWPHQMRLPLKRRADGKLGFLSANHEDKYRVFIGFFFFHTETCPSIPYESPEEILDDDWMVD